MIRQCLKNKFIFYPGPMERIKILYVDDNPIDLFLFRKIFEDIFDLAFADSVDRAIAYIENTPSVRVVVTDWQMPVKDGLSLLLHVHKFHPGIFCTMLSDRSDIGELKPYLKSGVIRKYFRKPLERERFLKEIISLVG